MLLGYYPDDPDSPKVTFGTKEVICTENCDFEFRYFVEGEDFEQDQEILEVVLTSYDENNKPFAYRTELLNMRDGSRGSYSDSIGESTLWSLAYVDMAPGTYRVDVDTSRLVGEQVHVEVDAMDTIRDQWSHIGESCGFSFCGGDTTCRKMPINLGGDFWRYTAPCIMDAQCPANCQDIPNGEGNFTTDKVCLAQWSRD